MKEIIGKPFKNITRAADMLCLHIGENIVKNINNKERIVSEFSFHIQIQWRFIQNNTILLASRDIYEPYDENVPDDWDYDIVGRAKEESSIFDVLNDEIVSLLKNTIITDCYVSPLGDLKILFSNGVVFETFTSTSRKEEVWRFINFTSGEHTVIFDD